MAAPRNWDLIVPAKLVHQLDYQQVLVRIAGGIIPVLEATGYEACVPGGLRASTSGHLKTDVYTDNTFGIDTIGL